MTARLIMRGSSAEYETPGQACTVRAFTQNFEDLLRQAPQFVLYRPSSVFTRARVACKVARGTSASLVASRTLKSMVRN